MPNNVISSKGDISTLSELKTMQSYGSDRIFPVVLKTYAFELALYQLRASILLGTSAYPTCTEYWDLTLLKP